MASPRGCIDPLSDTRLPPSPLERATRWGLSNKTRPRTGRLVVNGELVGSQKVGVDVEDGDGERGSQGGAEGADAGAGSAGDVDTGCPSCFLPTVVVWAVGLGVAAARLGLQGVDVGVEIM